MVRIDPAAWRLPLLLVAVGAAACADDPVYVQPAAGLEMIPGEGDEAAVTAQLVLPIRLEEEDEAAARADRAADLGIDVPFVARDDLDLSVEWTIKNLDPEPGVARIQVNGASEYFAYAPLAFVLDPDDDEEPPPLVGNIPLEIPGGGERAGVFQEDLLAEGCLDLELITRGGRSPFAAMLKVDEYRDEFDTDAGTIIPREAFASLVRFDISFVADRHMILEYAVRVRDHRSPPLLHDELGDAPAGELTVFAPADFAPVLE
jgi:hypothetical protein